MESNTCEKYKRTPQHDQNTNSRPFSKKNPKTKINKLPSKNCVPKSNYKPDKIL